MAGGLNKGGQTQFGFSPSSKKKDSTDRKNQLVRQLQKAEHFKLIDNQEYFRARNDLDSNGYDALIRWEKILKERFGNTETPSDTQDHIIQEINEQEKDIDSTNIGYAPRAIVMATLPRSKPKSLEFKRSSGDFTLLLHVPNELHKETGISLPYGPQPRLIFLWLASEIKRVGEPILHLGNTRSEFMRNVGIEPRTGKRGNMKTFEQQFKNLLGTTFSAWRNGGDAQSGNLSLHHRFIAKDADLWWNHGEQSVFEATISLDDQFFTEMKSGGIPIDLNTIAHFKDNSMALDIYIWLTYRFATLHNPRKLPWEWIFNQFASGEYAETPIGRKNFRAFFLKNLKIVLAHYTEANIRSVHGGLMLHPSPTHVPLLSQ